MQATCCVQAMRLQCAQAMVGLLDFLILRRVRKTPPADLCCMEPKQSKQRCFTLS